MHPIKTMPAKINKLEKTNSLAMLKLTLPPNQKFTYSAGQYIDVTANGITRSYSIANTKTTNSLELHIRYRKGGAFSELLWNTLQENQIVQIKGPLGGFILNEQSDKNLLLVCTGTGFAPIKAILEYIQINKISRPIHLIWGNYQQTDFYLLDLITKPQENLNIQVTLCCSNEKITDFYFGLVTTYINETYNDLSNYEIYVCGNPLMINDLRKISTQLNLNATNFFADSFTPA